MPSKEVLEAFYQMPDKYLSADKVIEMLESAYADSGTRMLSIVMPIANAASDHAWEYAKGYWEAIYTAQLAEKDTKITDKEKLIRVREDEFLAIKERLDTQDTHPDYFLGRGQGGSK